MAKKHGKNMIALRREVNSLLAPYRKKVPQVPIDRLIEHIDHAVRIAGIDHVALGSDFDGISLTPVGLEDVSRIGLITQKLLQRGYAQEDIYKILGENLLRVFRIVIGN